MENDMSNAPMDAFEMTQTIGKAQAERERAEEIARLYGQLESALRSGAKAYIVDGLEQAIHNWRTREFYAPYLYEGIRADFAKFLGTQLVEANNLRRYCRCSDEPRTHYMGGLYKGDRRCQTKRNDKTTTSITTKED
jgi:hypothetical protein